MFKVQAIGSSKLFRRLRYSYPRYHLVSKCHHPLERNSWIYTWDPFFPYIPQPRGMDSSPLSSGSWQWDLSPSGTVQSPSRYLGFWLPATWEFVRHYLLTTIGERGLKKSGSWRVKKIKGMMIRGREKKRRCESREGIKAGLGGGGGRGWRRYKSD